MSRRYTTGFDILGMDRDPTPGDPDRIDDLARFYEEIRDDAQTGVRVLGRGGSLSRARGESMEKLRDMLDNLPRKLQQTVVSFDAAAQAYRTYARVLRDQQTRIDTAMDQATEVVAAARRTLKTVPAGATPEQLVQARAEADGIAGARAQLSAARRLAADARRLREAASARCNLELDDAADKAIKPPPRRRFFQRIGDFFRNNPIFRLIIDIVIAVVGVVFPVVGIVLAAVALVVTVAVQAANGNFELGTLLVGLVTLVPGAKLIGPFVRGAKSVAPGLVKTVSSGAEAFGTFGRNNTVISGALRFGGRAPTLGKQLVADFGKGVVEEVATVGLNKLGNPNSEGFNAASIFGGAAVGAAAGGLFEAGADSFRKNSGDVDLDFRKGDGPLSAGGDSVPTSSSADVGGSGTGDVGPSTGDGATGGAAPTGDSGPPTDRTDTPSRPDPVDPSPAGDRTDPEPSVPAPAPVDAPQPSSAPAVSSPPDPPVNSQPDSVGVLPETPTPAAGADADRTGRDIETGSAAPQQPPAEPAPVASAPAAGPSPTGSPTPPAPSKPAAGGEPPDDSVPVGGAEPSSAGSDQIRTDTPPAPEDSVAAESAGPPEPVQPAPSAVPAPSETPNPGVDGSTTGPDTTRPQPEPATASPDESTSADADAEIDPDKAREERAVEAATAAISGEASRATSEAIEERQGEEPDDETAKGELKFGFLLDEDLSPNDSSAGDDTGFTKRVRR
ncbi:hypothetical protein [Actinoplanes sp. NPDC026670]|uniref:hypothetical protein n=1 Tax=Actinoplanes sp. NPDC026670 TaxID=3154700 RepID=UPI0033F4D9F2